MKVSRMLEINESLIAIGKVVDSDKNLTGIASFKIAKNIHLLKDIVDIVSKKKSEWLQSNSEPNDKGEYNLKGDTLKNFIDYINPILNEDEELPQGFKTLNVGGNNCDIPNGVPPLMLLPLIGVCLSEDETCKT